MATRESGNARFNVMALSEYNNGTEYTSKKARVIKSGEWSTSSINEWVMFAGQLGITTSNYSGYGLKKEYWSSSYINDDNVYFIRFSDGVIRNLTMNFNGYPVRLTRTF